MLTGACRLLSACIADINTQSDAPAKDPTDWKSGDDPATPSQLSYLKTLAEQAGVESPAEDLTKAEASEEIDRLRTSAGFDNKS